VSDCESGSCYVSESDVGRAFNIFASGFKGHPDYFDFVVVDCVLVCDVECV
jgi:hypothetical protein